MLARASARPQGLRPVLRPCCLSFLPPPAIGVSRLLVSGSAPIAVPYAVIVLIVLRQFPMRLSIPALCSQVIALCVLAITIATLSLSASPAVAASRSAVIIADELTLDDVAYSPKEERALRQQITKDQARLRQRYLDEHSDDDDAATIFDNIWEQALKGESALARAQLATLYQSLQAPGKRAARTNRLIAYLSFASANDDVAYFQQTIFNALSQIKQPTLTDQRRIYYWLNRLANSNSGKDSDFAASLLGLRYLSSLYQQPHNKQLKALTQKYLTQGAEGGIPNSAFALANFYLGSAHNSKEGAKWMKAAAQAGHGTAAGTLGLLYAQGTGVKTDYQQALHWAKLGVERGDARSHDILGLLYEMGWGIKADVAKALDLYSQGCKLGDDLSCQDHQRLTRQKQ